MPLDTPDAGHEFIAEEAASFPCLRILLAEDDLTCQVLLKRILERNGHTVTCACTGKEALTILEKETFDIFLTDIMMPEMDGVTATRELRKDERSKDLPVVAVTAYCMSEKEEVEFLEAGVDGFVPKPLDWKELKKCMARAMEKRRYPGPVL